MPIVVFICYGLSYIGHVNQFLGNMYAEMITHQETEYKYCNFVVRIQLSVISNQ
jgi:hypothetical protein